jgi:hypothetical protein
LVRIPALSILTIAMVLTPALARAQTYAPGHPVCLQDYGEKGDYIECGYSSLPQCQASASGRAAQCIVNPYFGGAQATAGPNYPRHRRIR